MNDQQLQEKEERRQVQHLHLPQPPAACNVEKSLVTRKMASD